MYEKTSEKEEGNENNYYCQHCTAAHASFILRDFLIYHIYVLESQGKIKVKKLKIIKCLLRNVLHPTLDSLDVIECTNIMQKLYKWPFEKQG